MAIMSRTTLYLSFLLATFFLIKSLPAASSDKTFVEKTCNNTDSGIGRTEFCIKTLLSDPQSLNISSIDGLAVIALNIAIRSADSASNYAQDMSGSDQYAGTPEATAFGICASSYGTGADNLRDAQSDLPNKEFQAAEDLASQAEDGADTCEKAFADQGVKSLMTDTNKLNGDLCRLCFDLIDLLNVV